MKQARSSVFPEPADLWTTPVPEVRDERRSDQERSDIIRKGFWIDHRAARETSAKISEFIGRQWQEHQRWRGMLFVGDPNNGRSSLISAIVNQRTYSAEKAVVARLSWPIIEGRFWATIIEAAGRASYAGSVPDLRSRALGALDRRQAIVFDIEDPPANAGTRLWPLLAKLKGLGEDRRIPVILVVPPKVAAKIAASADWGDRFETVRLPRWHVDRDYLDLLSAWEALLPLKEVSHLAGRELALHLYSLCDGKIGVLARILRQASLAAIESSTERITVAQLDNLGFGPPASFAGFRF